MGSQKLHKYCSSTPGILQIMRVLTILLVIVGVIAGVIGDDLEECDKKSAEAEACRTQAYATFKEAIARGTDKRPDWMARKSCNYLTDIIDKCGNILVGCKTQAEVDQEKDEQLKDSLANVKEKLLTWDSTKCPAIKAHEERVKAAAAAKQNAEPQPDPTGSATTLTVSFLFTLVLAMLV